MRATVAFGKHGVELDLPAGYRYDVLHAHAAPPVVDLNAEIASALDCPIGAPPLQQMATGCASAAIAVCDITRPAPNRLTLPPVIERLLNAGIQREKITIFIATGLHRPATPDELDIILGPEIVGHHPIVNHDARIREAHRFLGETRRGTPVAIESRFLDADLHISLGLIEPHLMLGFSGGRKLIAPGLAAQETIKVIHSPRFMREALAVEGSVDENPLHDELLNIARMARHDFILDVTLTRMREISGVFAGGPVQAHAAGVAALRYEALERLDEPVDAVITSAAGYPLDLTFYQTIKGVTAAQHIVKRNGPILVLGECTEGIGSPEFAAKLHGYRGHQEYLDAIRDSPVEVDQWQLEKLALVGLKHRLLFYAPGVVPASLGSLGTDCFMSAPAAIAQLLRMVPKGGRVAVIPEGPYVYARVHENELAINH